MATFDPYSEQIMGLREQQALAQKLRDSGLEAPQGQTVSGRFVAPATTQYLAQALKSYLGGQDVANAQQGIKDLMAQRQKETADYLAAMPKATTSDMEVRTPENVNQMGPSPFHKEVTIQPSTQDYMAWATKAPGMDAATAAQMGLKSAEMQAARDARIAEARIRGEEALKRDQQHMQMLAAMKGNQPEKPLTEFQGKSVMFGTRAADSHNILNRLEETANPLAVTASEKGGIFTNWAIDPQNQQVAQAQRNFINAVLRQESGASISSSEFDNAKKQYFPQAGDSPETIAQKRANRELVIKGFARQAGPAGAADIAEVYNAKPVAPASSAAPAQPTNPSNMNDLAAAAAAEMARRQRNLANQGRP